MQEKEKTTSSLGQVTGDKTGLIKPSEKALEEAIDSEIVNLLPLAGTIELTKAQQKVLYEAVNEGEVEIRPDGLIYLPWMEYVSRLKEAFGTAWAIIPKGMPKFGPGHSSILWGFWLMIGGKPSGFAIGEQEYFENNPMMTWGDACEGAKSNALMRLCKGIGISLELWKPSFIRQWKANHAETYEEVDRHGQLKIRWRKKGSVPKEPEKKAEKSSKVKEQPVAKKEEPKQEKADRPKESKPQPTPTPPSDEEDPLEKEDVILKLEKQILDAGLNKPQFKEYLYEFQPQYKRFFVEQDEEENLSFHKGRLLDLKLLSVNFSWAKNNYFVWCEKNQRTP